MDGAATEVWVWYPGDESVVGRSAPAAEPGWSLPCASLATAVVAPMLMRRSDAIASRIQAMEPRRFREVVEAYQDWLAQIRMRQGSSVLWRLTGWRFGQVAVHILFVSAFLLFWQPGYRVLVRLLGEDFLFPGGLRILFWTAFGLFLTAPLIALWRNIEAGDRLLLVGATRQLALFKSWLAGEAKGISGEYPSGR